MVEITGPEREDYITTRGRFSLPHWSNRRKRLSAYVVVQDLTDDIVEPIGGDLLKDVDAVAL